MAKSLSDEGLENIKKLLCEEGNGILDRIRNGGEFINNEEKEKLSNFSKHLHYEIYEKKNIEPETIEMFLYLIDMLIGYNNSLALKLIEEVLF